MKPEFVGILVCPSCRADASLRAHVFDATPAWGITEGVVSCSSCGEWYPIEDGVLELLTGGLAYRGERETFWRRHESDLRRIGLQPWARREGAKDVGAELQQQAHFDWYADNPSQSYDSYEQTSFWRAEDALVFERWKTEVHAGSRLLDIGCAQGRSSSWVADEDVELIGIDVSKALVRQAIKRHRDGGHRARATFFVADGQQLPFVTACFDYVLIYGVLHHLADPAVACAEVVRVLKPGGVYFGSENNATVFRWIFELLQRLNTLWHEEAGSHALIGERELRRWLGSAMKDLTFRTSVFLPPHVFGPLSVSASRRLLRATDAFFGALPLLKRQGGLIVVRGVRA